MTPAGWCSGSLGSADVVRLYVGFLFVQMLRIHCQPTCGHSRRTLLAATVGPYTSFLRVLASWRLCVEHSQRAVAVSSSAAVPASTSTGRAVRNLRP